MTDNNRRMRTVAGIVNSVETLEGEGFLVHRPFPTYALSEFDPFLLLDEMGPTDLAPGKAKVAPDRPHRRRLGDGESDRWRIGRGACHD